MFESSFLGLVIDCRVPQVQMNVGGATLQERQQTESSYMARFSSALRRLPELVTDDSSIVTIFIKDESNTVLTIPCVKDMSPPKERDEKRDLYARRVKIQEFIENIKYSLRTMPCQNCQNPEPLVRALQTMKKLFSESACVQRAKPETSRCALYLYSIQTPSLSFSQSFNSSSSSIEKSNSTTIDTKNLNNNSININQRSPLWVSFYRLRRSGFEGPISYGIVTSENINETMSLDWLESLRMFSESIRENPLSVNVSNFPTTHIDYFPILWRNVNINSAKNSCTIDILLPSKPNDFLLCQKRMFFPSEEEEEEEEEEKDDDENTNAGLLLPCRVERRVQTPALLTEPSKESFFSFSYRKILDDDEINTLMMNNTTNRKTKRKRGSSKKNNDSSPHQVLLHTQAKLSQNGRVCLVAEKLLKLNGIDPVHLKGPALSLGYLECDTSNVIGYNSTTTTTRSLEFLALLDHLRQEESGLILVCESNTTDAYKQKSYWLLLALSSKINKEETTALSTFDDSNIQLEEEEECSSVVVS